MISIIIRWLIITVAILLSAAVIPGIRVDSITTGFVAAGLLGLINTFIRPVLILLTLPLNILTLGIFSFVINAFLLKLVAHFVAGLEVESFLAAFLGALVISFVTWITGGRVVVRTKKWPKKPEPPDKPNCIDLKQKGDGKWE